MCTPPQQTSCVHCTYFRRLVLLVVALCIFFGGGSTAFSAVKASIKNAPTQKLPAEEQYQAAKAYAVRLERDIAFGKNRTNWLNGAYNFQKIFLAERKKALGPPSLYMSARLYQGSFKQFKVPADQEAALSGFLELADIYPGHTLADDALYNAAQCASLSSNKEQLANELYRKIVAQYPQGDRYENAKAQIKTAEKEKPPPAVTSVLPAVTTEAPTTATPPLSLLLPIKYWSSPGYSRIVIETTAPIHYTAGLMEKNENRSRQLYVDFARSYVAPQLRAPVAIKEGLLKQFRSDQRGEEGVRVMLDLESLADYKIFNLNDPFRVVVDIRGVVPDVRTPQLSENKPTKTSTPVTAPATAIALPPRNEATGDTTIISLTDLKKRAAKVEIPVLTPTSSREKLSLAQQLGLGIRKIVIDPGHGGKDPGAMAFGLKEKDIVLKISSKIAKILKDTYRYEVVLTRTKDVYIPLEERTAIANSQKSDLFVSIHINAHSDQQKSGIETYFLNLATDANAMRIAARENASSTHSIGEMQDILTSLMKNSKIDESSRLARFVQTNLVSGQRRSYKPRDLGVKQAPFYVLIGAEMPAVLAEISFLTNRDEANLLKDEQYLNTIAEQLAEGIVAYVDHHHTAAVRL